MIRPYRHYQINYFCGWQYIFSPIFRNEVHQKWAGNTWDRSLCVIGGISGMVITTGIFALAIWAAINSA